MKNPLADLTDEIAAARRDRRLIRNAEKRSRAEYLPPLFAFFASQFPLIAFRGQGKDFFGFALALQNFRKPPIGSTAAQVRAFWLSQRRAMEAEWGSPTAHKARGIDPVTSEFLCWLNRRHNRLALKQSFLQEFEENDWRFAKTMIVDQSTVGQPHVYLQIHDFIQPAISKLMIEVRYRQWARNRSVPRTVVNNLSKLVKALSLSSVNMSEALQYYGAAYDSGQSRRQQVAEVAAAIMAAESGSGTGYGQDHILAHDARTTIYAEPSIRKNLPP